MFSPQARVIIPEAFRKNRGIGALRPDSELISNLEVSPAAVRTSLMEDMEDSTWKAAIILSRNNEGEIVDGSHVLAVKSTCSVKIRPDCFPVDDAVKDKLKIFLSVNLNSISFPSGGPAPNLSDWVDGKHNNVLITTLPYDPNFLRTFQLQDHVG